MRDSVFFFVNGQRHQIGGAAAFCSLTEFLRQDLRQTGTKVVCAEGDCGACTVLVGWPDGNKLRYETADACILFLHQLDGAHVITIEGLADDGELHPVQQALVDYHGSQCGFCTPGFAMALAGMVEAKADLQPDEVRLGLTGNLCRCTGYVQILEAAASLRAVPPLDERFANNGQWHDLQARTREPVLIRSTVNNSNGNAVERTYFSPRTLEEAVDFKARHPESVLISGATELGVVRNKKGLEPAVLMSLSRVPGLAEITRTGDALAIGANVRWTRLESYMRAHWPEFHRIIVRFGSPQIRNMATLAGNVANGSPIADSLPLLYVMEGEVELLCRRGSRRVKIHEFYKGYKVKEVQPDEFIVRIHLPLPRAGDLVKLYKVSRRNDLDIATFGAAIRLQCRGEHIDRAWIAYGGVAPTVLRLPGTEAFLHGKQLVEETFVKAGKLARTEIAPITDVRGTKDFRLQLAENVLLKFFFECQDKPSFAQARST